LYGVQTFRLSEAFKPNRERFPGDFLFQLTARGVLAIDPLARSSMWEDLQAGRATEIDWLNGEVVRYAPDEGDLLAIERNIRAIWDAVVRAAQTGDWRPRTSRLCDWCDFRDLCPAWGGTPPPLPEGAEAIALDPARSGAAVPADD